MRVLFYHASPAWTSGARVFVAAARRLAAEGDAVMFVCPAPSLVSERAAATGCAVVPIDPAASIPVACWALRRVLVHGLVEAVFVHTEREHLIAAMAVRLAGRGGVVRRTPVGAAPQAGTDTRLALRLASSGFVFASPADSQGAPVYPSARETVVAELGVDVAHHDAVRPAAAPLLGAPAGARIVVCLSDSGAKLRTATVLRTVAMLLPRHPELHLVVLGEGSIDDDVRMHAAALGVSRHVSFLGERDDELAVVRAGALVWVVADGERAAFGALDAMAMGLPVLIERGTVAERYVADGITGVVLPPGETPVGAAAVARLLGAEDHRVAMGAAGRARVAREYTEVAMVGALRHAAESARDRRRWVR